MHDPLTCMLTNTHTHSYAHIEHRPVACVLTVLVTLGCNYWNTLSPPEEKNYLYQSLPPHLRLSTLPLHPSTLSAFIWHTAGTRPRVGVEEEVEVEEVWVLEGQRCSPADNKNMAPVKDNEREGEMERERDGDGEKQGMKDR